jgi:hypothetical protein
MITFLICFTYHVVFSLANLVEYYTSTYWVGFALTNLSSWPLVTIAAASKAINGTGTRHSL